MEIIVSCSRAVATFKTLPHAPKTPKSRAAKAGIWAAVGGAILASYHFSVATEGIATIGSLVMSTKDPILFGIALIVIVVVARKL